ncbi:hypothetical protein [Aliiglaciecola sp. M165]|uniref:hypothetical protein n=1 Tax=Aliiglaciecola sp. M165 TaxID=2593649 RepID=UPI00118084F0|nr:hypothetical protein [Aliiglaciecola sp. M165]TRY29809.1 hypothetical protein FM019_16695 [Aliiglaciecola sp. M165]
MTEPTKDTIEHWIAKPVDDDRAIISARPVDESEFTAAQKERMRDLDIYLPRSNGLFRMRSELSVTGDFVFQKASGVWTHTMAKIMRGLRLELISKDGDYFLEDANMNAVIPHGNDNEEPWRITNWKVESKKLKVDPGDPDNPYEMNEDSPDVPIEKVFEDTLRWETTVGGQPFSVDTVAAWRGYGNQNTE